MKGIDLFKRACSNLDINQLEELISSMENCFIPEGYKWVLTNISLGQCQFDIPYKAYDSIEIAETGIKFVTNKLEYHKEILISHFYSIPELIREWKHAVFDEHYEKDQILPIGINEVPHCRLYIGMSIRNSGKIYTDHDNPIDPLDKVIIEDSILSFLGGLETTKSNDELMSSNYIKTFGSHEWVRNETI